MAEWILARAQRNDIFEMIRAVPLDPADFAWSQEGKGDGLAEVITHTPTDAQCKFSRFQDGGFWLHWWPSRNQSVRYDNAPSWQFALNFVVDWLAAVEADHRAPDLWGEVAKEKTISGAAARTEYENPFSVAELKLLETSLADIEHYIEATQPLDPAAKQAVHSRFVYLLDAAKNGARKIDWLNIFIAQIVTMVVSGLLDPRVYGAVMSHAATVLNAIFQFGLKLIG